MENREDVYVQLIKNAIQGYEKKLEALRIDLKHTNGRLNRIEAQIKSLEKRYTEIVLDTK